MNDEKTLLREVFGESSDSDAEDFDRQQQQNHQLEEDPSYEDGSESNVDQNLSWQQIEEIKGLCLCRHFLSPQQQSYLLSAIEREGWFTNASNNQAMRFGDLPTWALKLSDSIHEAVLHCDHDLATSDGDKETYLLPSDMLCREPLFDQLIVNVYQPGEVRYDFRIGHLVQVQGICAHVDLMQFEDGIAIVSLESPCVMHFTRVEEAFATAKGGTEDTPAAKIPVYLTPGSLVLMSGEARYLWKHEINRKPGFQIWEGEELNQTKRTSVTLRKLCHA